MTDAAHITYDDDAVADIIDSDTEAESDSDTEIGNITRGPITTSHDRSTWSNWAPPPDPEVYTFVAGYKGKPIQRSMSQLKDTLGRGGSSCYQESLTSAIHLFFDYEVYYGTEAEQMAADAPLLRRIVDMIIDATGVAEDRISILKACGAKPQAGAEPKYINSYHLIVLGPKFVFSCGADARKYIEDVIPADFTPMYDNAVYQKAGTRRLFRAPLQEKGGNDYRVMTPHIIGRPPMSRAAAYDWLFGKDGRIADYLVTAYDRVAMRMMPPDPDMFFTYNEPSAMKITAAGAGSVISAPPAMFESALELLGAMYPDEILNYTFDEPPRGNLLLSRRIEGTASKCIVCGVTHDRYTPIIVVQGNGAIYTCSRRKDHKAKAIVLRANTQKRPPGHVLRTALEAPETKAAPVIDAPDADHNIAVDVKYMADAPQLAAAIAAHDAAFIGIRAPMGSGKSVAVSRLINADTSARVIVITMRISLSEKYREDYPDFAHYADAKADITAPRAIVVIDSIHRVSLDRAFDIVVLDESEAFVAHLTSDTFVRQPTLVDTMARLKNIMGRAGRIVAMDANLSQHGMSILKSLRAEGIPDAAMTTTVITNTHIAASRDIILTHDRREVITDIAHSLAAGKRCYVAMNNGAKRIAVAATAMCVMANRRMAATGVEPRAIKCLVVTSITLSSEPVRAALRDPRGEWGKYDLIVVSPSIQSGISYDRDDFDRVFGIFNNVTNSCSDMMQQLSRIRHPRDNTIRVSLTRHNSPMAAIVTAQDLLDHITENTAGVTAERALRSGAIGYRYDSRGLKEISETLFYRIYRDNLLRANADRRAVEANFIRIARAAGHRPAAYDVEPLEPEEAKVVLKALKDISAIAAEDENAALAAADNIDQDRAAKLDADLRAGALDHKEAMTAKMTLWRHRLMNTYDAPCDAILPPEWFKLRKDKGRVYRNMQRYADDFDDGLTALLAHECDEDAFARSQAGDEPVVINTISEKRHARHKLLLGLLESYNIASLTAGETDRDTIINMSGAIFDDIKHTAHVLGKNPRVVASLATQKLDDSRACAYILKFINPSLTAEFGMKLVQTKQRSGVYAVQNAFAEALAASAPIQRADHASDPAPATAAASRAAAGIE
jgi:hypothetical protein